MISSIIKNNILTAYRTENMNISSLSSRYGMSEKSVEKIIFPNGRNKVLLKPSSITVKKVEKILMPIPPRDKKEIQREAGRKAAITRKRNLEIKAFEGVPLYERSAEPIQLSDSERIKKLEETVAQLQLSIKHLIKIANGNL